MFWIIFTARLYIFYWIFFNLMAKKLKKREKIKNRENISSCISVLFNAMSICHLRFPGITIVLFVLCSQNVKPKERKKKSEWDSSPQFIFLKGRKENGIKDK